MKLPAVHFKEKNALNLDERRFEQGNILSEVEAVGKPIATICVSDSSPIRRPLLGHTRDISPSERFIVWTKAAIAYTVNSVYIEFNGT